MRVLLVHGFTQTAASWGRLADELRATALDAPGHGSRSGLAGLDLWAGATVLGDVGGRGAWVGYSMGGRLCLHLALSHSHLVERLVVLGASPGIEDPAERAARRAADDERAAEIERDGVAAFLERWLAQPLFAGLPSGAAGMEARLENTAAGLSGSLRYAGVGTQDDLWPRLPELEMPVLVVAGERDEKFSAIGRRMAEAIGANARFESVPGAGHTAHLEQPDAFLSIVRPFLASET